VRDVRVFARRSSLAGQLVACEFVAAPGFDPHEVQQAILSACRAQLDVHERPRFVQPVSAIPLSEAGKKIRTPPGTTATGDPSAPSVVDGGISP
jgi:hypothetical protein